MCFVAQQLYVMWLRPEAAPGAEAWLTTKLVRQLTTSGAPWRSLVDPAAVVHGCRAKMRPKYMFPNPDQADYFAKCIALLQQNKQMTEMQAPPPEGDADDAGDDDNEMDDDVHDADEIDW